MYSKTKVTDIIAIANTNIMIISIKQVLTVNVVQQRSRKL